MSQQKTLKLGQRLLEEAKFQEAISTLESYQPSSSFIQLYRAMAYHYVGQSAKALEILFNLKPTELAPQVLSLHLGLVYFDEHQFSLAKQVIQEQVSASYSLSYLEAIIDLAEKIQSQQMPNEEQIKKYLLVKNSSLEIQARALALLESHMPHEPHLRANDLSLKDHYQPFLFSNFFKAKKAKKISTNKEIIHQAVNEKNFSFAISKLYELFEMGYQQNEVNYFSKQILNEISLQIEETNDLNIEEISFVLLNTGQYEKALSHLQNHLNTHQKSTNPTIIGQTVAIFETLGLAHFGLQNFSQAKLHFSTRLNYHHEAAINSPYYLAASTQRADSIFQALPLYKKYILQNHDAITYGMQTGLKTIFPNCNL